MKNKTNLVCLPFAGGNKYSYREFAEKAPSFLNIITLEYAGRGGRMKENLPGNAVDVVEDLYSQLTTLINNDETDYAIYGHSMGGLMAYLLTNKMIDNKQRLPVHIFITGTTGPSAISRSEKKRHLMDQKDFIQEIRDLDGMPEEILDNEELLYYFEPILRSDFKISENFIYEEREPFNLPVTVVTGTEEDMELSDIALWQNETRQVVDFKRMPGKHFFIFTHAFKMVEIISKKLYLHKTLQ